MLKSWKTRALVTAGAVALVAPFSFTGGAFAATVPTGLSATSASGTPTAGSSINVNGSCALVNAAPQTAIIRLRGPNTVATVTDPVVASSNPTVTNTTFQGTLVIPSGARVGDSFFVGAACVDNQGVQSMETSAGTVTVVMGSVLGSTTGVTGIVNSTTGTGLTSTSGTTAGATGTGTTAGGTSTTSVAVPITATPSFTG
ncbi:MAG: hypothetical protein M3256_10185 [Actinomycetota bacterium]|nr:hypothetical protein [Actinomycetota bacterium]